MMANKDDAHWMVEKYPALAAAGDAVAGTIEVTAGYSQLSNLFVILENAIRPPADAVVFAGSFRIRIEQRTRCAVSRLPAVYVDDVDPIPDRHFLPDDKSACLCSPFEEDEFLKPDLQFRPFLEQLIIPFLYGQLYYSSKGRWPWKEYAHGVTGLLEAYSLFGGESRAAECLQKLARYPAWPDIKRALGQKPYMKGHIRCFCEKKDKIRRCHPDALAGLRRLQGDIKALGIAIP